MGFHVFLRCNSYLVIDQDRNFFLEQVNLNPVVFHNEGNRATNRSFRTDMAYAGAPRAS